LKGALVDGPQMLVGQTASWHLPAPTRGCPAGPALLQLEELRLPPRGPQAPRLTGAGPPAWKKGDGPGQMEQTPVSGAGPRLRPPRPPSSPRRQSLLPEKVSEGPRAALRAPSALESPPRLAEPPPPGQSCRPVPGPAPDPASRGDSPSPQSRAAGFAVGCPVTEARAGAGTRPRSRRRPRATFKGDASASASRSLHANSPTTSGFLNQKAPRARGSPLEPEPRGRSVRRPDGGAKFPASLDPLQPAAWASRLRQGTAGPFGGRADAELRR
ncbi:hypothetical protein EI555_012740, partial [Monodon monoceros]